MPQFSQTTRTDRHNPSRSTTRSKKDGGHSSYGHGSRQIAQENDAAQHLSEKSIVSEKHSPSPGFSLASISILPDPCQLRGHANPGRMPSASPPAVWPVQAKLAINHPGDKYEEEVDRVAEQVVRMPDPVTFKGPVPSQPPLIQRSCPKCRKSGEREEDEEPLQTKPLPAPARGAAQTSPSSVPPVVHEVLRAPGRPLDAATRAFMEPRFGYDFSRVRIHTDVRAAESARAMNASAFTVMSDLTFNAGQYAPSTEQGLRLLAHELTHVLQQTVPDENKIGPNSELLLENHADALGIQSEISEYSHIDSPIPVRASTIQREELGSRVTHPRRDEVFTAQSLLHLMV